MRCSFNTLNHSVIFGLPPTLPEQVRAAAAAGYDDIGLDLSSVLAHEAEGLDPAALGALVREHGLGCYELAVVVLSSDDTQAREALDVVRRVAEGVRPAIVYAISFDPIDDALLANAQRARAALADLGVGLAIEFAAGFGVGTLADATEVAVAAGTDVGVVIDCWQLARTGGSADDLAALGLDRLGFLQLSDVAVEAATTVDVEMSNGRLLPGEGLGEAPAVCRAARALGYDGHLSVEVLSATWRARPVEELITASLAATRAAWDAGAPAT